MQSTHRSGPHRARVIVLHEGGIDPDGGEGARIPGFGEKAALILEAGRAHQLHAAKGFFNQFNHEARLLRCGEHPPIQGCARQGQGRWRLEHPFRKPGRGKFSNDVSSGFPGLTRDPYFPAAGYFIGPPSRRGTPVEGALENWRPRDEFRCATPPRCDVPRTSADGPCPHRPHSGLKSATAR